MSIKAFVNVMYEMNITILPKSVYAFFLILYEAYMFKG